jgi:chromate transporter
MLTLFLVFVKMGAMVFGGGYAMVPIVERELIKKRQWTTMDDLLDYYAIAQVTPGVIAVNVSTFIGSMLRGPLGGLLATIGFVLPGVLIMLLITILIITFSGGIGELAGIAHIMAGIRLAVGALVLDTVIKIGKKALVKNKKPSITGIIIFALSFAAAFFAGISPVWPVLCAAPLGILLDRIHAKRNQEAFKK